MKKIALSLVLLALLSLPAFAAEEGKYPDKPITLLTAFNPGGGSDTVHRLLEKYAKGIMTQPFVITYKAGAGGELGWTEAADAKPDGYFIAGVDLPSINLQPLVRKPGTPGYRTEQLLPIANLLVDPNCILVSKNSKWKTFPEFLEYVKAHPGKVRAAIVGKLSGDHTFLMQFEKLTGTKFNVIPYTGGAKVGPALQSGEAECYFGSLSSSFRLENTRCLAVGTPERYELAKDVPTLKELGYDITSMKRRGIVGPVGIPPERVAFLEEIFRKINENPDYVSDMKRLGQLPDFKTASEFAKIINDETRVNGELLKNLGYLNNGK